MISTHESHCECCEVWARVLSTVMQNMSQEAQGSNEFSSPSWMDILKLSILKSLGFGNSYGSGSSHQRRISKRAIEIYQEHFGDEEFSSDFIGAEESFGENHQFETTIEADSSYGTNILEPHDLEDSYDFSGFETDGPEEAFENDDFNDSDWSFGGEVGGFENSDGVKE